MRLGDLLSELRENILHDRSSQVSGASDYLWSDTTLVRYIDEAHRRFARKSLCIRDKNTVECCQFTTVANQDEYPLHPSVIAVLSVRMSGDKIDLARAGHSAFDSYHMPNAYFFDPSQASYLNPGKPLAFSTDETLVENDYGSMSVVSLRLFPMVSSDYAGLTATMRVCRLPLVPLCVEDLDAIPEIPPDYHLDMLDWAAYLALRIVDVDAGAPDRAQEFRASFEAHVAEARRENMRKLFVPAQWGFGRNGFSWES